MLFLLLSQDFPLLRLDDVVDDQSNIVGFSMLNISHPFYLEFIRSLNLSWREGCDLSPYPGPAVSLHAVTYGISHNSVLTREKYNTYAAVTQDFERVKFVRTVVQKWTGTILLSFTFLYREVRL